MKYKIAEKAYEINLSYLQESYLYDTMFCHAETANKAKVILLKENKYNDLKLNNGEEVEDKNIPVIRAKHLDKVYFEDQISRLDKVQELITKRERQNELNDFENNLDFQFFFILKRGSYYCEGFCGYTQFKLKAGIYTKKEAIHEARFCDEITIEPINVLEYNEAISKEISTFQSKIINPI